MLLFISGLKIEFEIKSETEMNAKQNYEISKFGPTQYRKYEA